MEIGKVPENVLKRSVFKKLTVKRPEVLVHAGVGEDCAVLAPTEDALVLSTDPITASAKEIGTIAFHITANDIASSGAELVGILLTIIMPPNSEEDELKQIMDDVSQLTEEYDVEILGGHTEVSAVVNQTLVSVTGIGRIAKDKLVTTKGLKPGQDLVVTKWIGLEGTSIIAAEFEEELKKRLPVSIVDESKKFASLFHKTPVTVFLVSATIPLIPGAALYRTMNWMLMKDWAKFQKDGIYTILFAVSMAAGMTLTTIAFRMAWRWMYRQRRM